MHFANHVIEFEQGPTIYFRYVRKGRPVVIVIVCVASCVGGKLHPCKRTLNSRSLGLC